MAREDINRIAATDSCEADLRRICGENCQDFEAALALFLSSDDPKGPHKARVALRRLTTCLDAFAPLMRRKPLLQMRQKAKSLFRTLGAIRDSDVYTANRAEQLGHPVRLRRNQKLRETTRGRLLKDKADTFAQRLMTALAPEGPMLRRNAKGLAMRHLPVRGFAAELLQEQWETALSFGPSVSAIPTRIRHEFRKTMKSMRYVSEFFVGQFPGLQTSQFQADFRDLQDALGVLNDFDVALAIDGLKRPKTLPEREANALAAAEALWHELSTETPPWADQDTRRP